MGNSPQHSEQVSPPSIVCLHFWAWRLRINISPEGQKSEIVILKLNSEIQLREVMILLLACILKLQFSIACTLYTLSTTFGKGFPNWVLSHTFMFLLFLLNIKVALCIPPLKTNISIEKWWLEDSLHFPLNMGPLKKKTSRETPTPSKPCMFRKSIEGGWRKPQSWRTPRSSAGLTISTFGHGLGNLHPQFCQAARCEVPPP